VLKQHCGPPLLSLATLLIASLRLRQILQRFAAFEYLLKAFAHSLTPVSIAPPFLLAQWINQ
jgi:hypothetical protein